MWTFKSGLLEFVGCGSPCLAVARRRRAKDGGEGGVFEFVCRLFTAFRRCSLTRSVPIWAERRSGRRRWLSRRSLVIIEQATEPRTSTNLSRAANKRAPLDEPILYTIGSFVHVLLVVAIVLFLVGLVGGRRVLG